MKNDDLLLKEIELHTKKKIVVIEEIDANKKASGEWEKKIYKIKMDDGYSYVLKRMHLKEHRFLEYKEIYAQELEFMPRLAFLKSIGNEEYIGLIEWVEGITLDKIFKDNYIKLLLNLKKIVMNTRSMHQSSRRPDPVSVSLEDIKIVLDREFLSNDQRQFLESYISERLNLINGRLKSIVHWDLHSRNMVLVNDSIRFIDFDDVRYGDPYMDLVYMANDIVPATKKEQLVKYLFLQYYFDYNIPEDFWEIVNVYSIIKIVFGMSDEIKNRKDHKAIMSFDTFLMEHENMKKSIPDWYRKLDKIIFWKK